MSFAIRVENLGKRYQLGATHAGSVRELVNRGWNRLFGRPEPVAQPITLDPAAADRVEGNAFWALKDVSFEVKPGEVVGIIGRNGSGKSTLLKILSQITAPTTGRIELHGRVASLLEVGTGFHPELSGRENVFLNGAILGMTKPEIRRKFDEIVAFAEIEKFIDTPVKRYSSGMYVRLAFAVAAHLEPEILIVDEVLAVGDAEFQKKCMGKMGSVAKEGRTVLFVSHQLSAIRALCSRCILLEIGFVNTDGETNDAIENYIKCAEKRSRESDISTMPRRGSGIARITGLRIKNSLGLEASTIAAGSGATISFQLENRSGRDLVNVSLGFSLHTLYGDVLGILYNDYAGVSLTIPPGSRLVELSFAKFPLSPGRYYVGARLLVNGIEADWPESHVGVIDVADGNFYGSSIAPHSGIGPFYFDGQWHVNRCEDD